MYRDFPGSHIPVDQMKGIQKCRASHVFESCRTQRSQNSCYIYVHITTVKKKYINQHFPCDKLGVMNVGTHQGLGGCLRKVYSSVLQPKAHRRRSFKRLCWFLPNFAWCERVGMERGGRIVGRTGSNMFWLLTMCQALYQAFYLHRLIWSSLKQKQSVYY